MRLDGAVRRRGVISMTSLIDVIFLLLLFFMLSSTFAKFGEIELTSGGGSAERQVTPVYLRLTDGRLVLNGRDIEIADIAEELATQAGQGANAVLLALDEKTTSQRFVDVYTALKSVRGFAVAVVR